jgi:hypothetical protein
MNFLQSATAIDWDTHERVLPGLRGWHMALCAAQLGDDDGQYLGYYKISAEEPPSYWEAASLIKGCTHLPRLTPREALRDAEDMARAAVYNLPAPRSLRAVLESRPLNVYELDDLGGRIRRRA